MVLVKPHGSLSNSQFILAKRLMWAMVVCPQTRLSNDRRKMACKGAGLPWPSSDQTLVPNT